MCEVRFRSEDTDLGGGWGLLVCCTVVTPSLSAPDQSPPVETSRLYITPTSSLVRENTTPLQKLSRSLTTLLPRSSRRRLAPAVLSSKTRIPSSSSSSSSRLSRPSQLSNLLMICYDIRLKYQDTFHEMNPLQAQISIVFSTLFILISLACFYT